jgi:TPR repeat protein
MKEIYDVFISYSRKDTDIANQICDAFDKHGITYFIDRQGIGGGQEFPDVLADAICDSNLFLFIASENSYESKFTKSEITFAFNEKPHNSILPYIIDASTPPRGIRFTFSAINWRNIKEHPIETTLVQDICKLLGKSYTATQKRDVTVSGGKSHTATVDKGNSAANIEKINSEELFSLGKKYYEETNYTEAAKYYRKAAKQNHAKAQYHLGECYEIGVGVGKNRSEAVKWYRMAADQGNVDAQYRLGFCYHYGECVRKNLSEAVKWYRMAAEQGDAEAQYQLGRCYYYGEGVDYDLSETVKWYLKAAEQGDGSAKANLKELAEKISDNKQFKFREFYPAILV